MGLTRIKDLSKKDQEVFRKFSENLGMKFDSNKVIFACTRGDINEKVEIPAREKPLTKKQELINKLKQISQPKPFLK